MSETTALFKEQQSLRSKYRNGLLVLQIGLPFALYFAMESGRDGLAGVITGLFVLGMTFLVGVG